MNSPQPPGAKLGRYEIRSQLGAGGMGEVYLAHDVKLGRLVALKILPADVAVDVDRMNRFVQEARSVSSLNHPNILTIHEFDEADSVHFMAMEFVDGATLRESILDRSLGIGEVIEVAIQIAGALAAAHAAGIIHRDIKPENIMLRRDGLVKVLDFGLAKPTEQKTSGSEDATRALVNTNTGIVMGTVAYMSPEQARGLAADARTDIWSLGVVIQELLTGRKPFSGPTTSDVLVAVLEREPEPLVHVAPLTPPELQRIVTKALRKKREERYQTIKDLQLDLKSLKQELEAGRLSGVAGTAGGTESRRDVASQSAILESTVIEERAGGARDVAVTAKPKRSSKPPLIAALVIVTVSGIGLAFFLRAGIYRWFSASQAAGAFQAPAISQLTSFRNLSQAAISPDGKYIAYALRDNEKSSLWLRQSSAANDLQVVPPAMVTYEGITFSRDATRLYYATRDRDGASALYQVQVLGGTPQKLLSGVDGPVTFSPDGRRIAFVRGKYPSADQSALMIAEANGREEKTLATRRSPQFFYPVAQDAGPSWSPDGQLIACAVADISSGRDGKVYTFRVRDGLETQIKTRSFAEISRVEWLADMSGLVMIATEQFKASFPGQVWFVSYPDGATRRITNDFANYGSLSMTADNSKLVTISLSDLYNVWVAPDGDSARAMQLTPSSRQGGLSWTPDGRIAYTTYMAGLRDIWLMNADGSNRKQLTNNAEENFEVSVSPDGGHVAFLSTRAGRGDLWRIDIDGGNPRQLTQGLLMWQPSWSPDGQWIFFVTYPDWKIWKVAVNGGPLTQVTDHPSYRPVVSPDGQSLACYYSDSSAAQSSDTVYNLAMLPVAGGAPVKTFPIRSESPSFSVLQWSADGRAIFYTATTNNVSNIWSQPVAGGPPEQVTHFKDASISAFAWSHDGRWLASSRGEAISDAVLISQTK